MPLTFRRKGHGRAVGGRRTLVLPNILQRKRQSSVFPLDDPHLSESTSTDDAQEAEVVQIHCPIVQPWLVFFPSALMHLGPNRRLDSDKIEDSKLTLAVELDGLALAVTHCRGDRLLVDNTVWCLGRSKNIHGLR
jgi:hypothetical protein